MNTPASLARDPLLPGAIAGYVVARVPVCTPQTTAGDLRRLLVGSTYESAVDVAVCRPDPRVLVGLVPVERVLGAPAHTPVTELMDPDPPIVAPGTDQEEAAWKAVHHGESSLAVVGEDGTFHGLVPPARLLAVLLSEHDRDLTRLGGFLDSTSSARHAMHEPLGARLWHRLPWLLLGLLGSAGAAVLVRGFEAGLDADVRLAFFIPGIVYMADAVGTQTETLVIRGLSVGVRIRRVFLTEALTGLVMGLMLALLAILGIWAGLGSFPLALAVGLSLLGACAVASVVAMLLPWAMSSAGRDPALGSGPLATVVQDLLSLVIYFVVTAAVLG